MEKNLAEYDILKTRNGREIAYVKTQSKPSKTFRPGIVFLGGFKSDMNGTKAKFLEKFAKKIGSDFVRFDYSGHGSSSGSFINGCISDWVEDSVEVLDCLTKGPQILVGSSMGGWISIILSKKRPKKISGIIGIAVAPDFTEKSIWSGMTKSEKSQLVKDGHIEIPSEYDEPYIITKKLIEDGRNNLVLDDDLILSFPVRLLQGMADKEVKYSEAVDLADKISCYDAEVILVKDADHSFSSLKCLSLIEDTLQKLLKEQ